MKILNKKISLGTAIAGGLIIGAVVYSLGYKMAMNKFNNILSYNQEKQKMYSVLSDIDYAVRKEYIGDIDETSLLRGISAGYIKGLSSDLCQFFTVSEYQMFLNNQKTIRTDVETFKLNDKIGYIKCFSMGENFSVNFINAVNVFVSDSCRNIIIDLRKVDYGIEEEAFKVLQDILPKGDIVWSVDANDKKNVVCRSNSDGLNLNIVVMIDSQTGGLAEIFAKSLKDCANAKIVGQKSAGKAVKQKCFNLPDDMILVYPEAHYVSKSGNQIFNVGITPDLTSNINENSEEDNQLQDAFCCFES